MIFIHKDGTRENRPVKEMTYLIEVLPMSKVKIAVEKLSVLGVTGEMARAALEALIQSRADLGWTMRGISPTLQCHSILVVFARKEKGDV
jgi:hypothetical protein